MFPPTCGQTDDIVRVVIFTVYAGPRDVLSLKGLHEITRGSLALILGIRGFRRLAELKHWRSEEIASMGNV